MIENIGFLVKPCKTYSSFPNNFFDLVRSGMQWGKGRMMRTQRQGCILGRSSVCFHLTKVHIHTALTHSAVLSGHSICTRLCRATSLRMASSNVVNPPSCQGCLVSTRIRMLCKEGFWAMIERDLVVNWGRSVTTFGWGASRRVSALVLRQPRYGVEL